MLEWTEYMTFSNMSIQIYWVFKELSISWVTWLTSSCERWAFQSRGIQGDNGGNEENCWNSKSSLSTSGYPWIPHGLESLSSLCRGERFKQKEIDTYSGGKWTATSKSIGANERISVYLKGKQHTIYFQSSFPFIPCSFPIPLILSCYSIFNILPISFILCYSIFNILPISLILSVIQSLISFLSLSYSLLFNL